MSEIEIYYTPKKEIHGVSNNHSDFAKDNNWNLELDIAYPEIILPQEIIKLITNNDSSIKEVEFGEYPQTKTDKDIQEKLEKLYKLFKAGNKKNNELKPTKNKYTIYENKSMHGSDVCEIIYDEYGYKDKKYIRYRDDLWFEVEPIKWEIKGNTLISKKGLFKELGYHGRYFGIQRLVKETSSFLRNNFLEDVLKSANLKKIVNYTNFEELRDIIKENNGFELYDGIAKIVFNGSLTAAGWVIVPPFEPSPKMRTL